MHTLAMVLMLSSGSQPSTRVLFDLEARFLCDELRPISLELIERTQVSLEVPKGCPDAGALLWFEVDCTQKPCEGTVRLGKQVVATLKEANQSLVVTTPARFEAGPASKLAIKVTDRQVLAVDGSEPERAMIVTGHTPDGQNIASVWAPPGQTSGLTFAGTSFEARFSRTDEDHVTLELDSPGMAHVKRTLRKAEPLTLDCAAQKLACRGTVVFDVRER